MRTHLTPAPEFQPSLAQRRFVEYVCAHPEFKSVTQFCEAAAVPRQTYEGWCRKPNFRGWFIREWASALLFEGWHVISLFFRLLVRRYERGSLIVTSNKSFTDWGEVFNDQVLATAILDRLLHHATTINIKGESYRLREKRKAGLPGRRAKPAEEPGEEEPGN